MVDRGNRSTCSYWSYFDVVKTISNQDPINCEFSEEEDSFSFVIEGQTISSERRIDEIWYDLTGKLRPLN